jgi:DNA-binding MarR family transcriptional regulator
VADSDPIELPAWGIGFFLSTLGFHSHAVWAERLAPLGLDSRQASILLHVAAAEGQPQQAFANALQIPPSRVVALVDELERRRLIKRRTNPADRRVRTLHLTGLGKTMVRKLVELEAAHEAGLCVGLEPAERERLIKLLKKTARGLGLSGTVHSGLDGDDW